MLGDYEHDRPLKNHCEIIGYVGFAGLVFSVFFMTF
jgi:hypothetical protein